MATPGRPLEGGVRDRLEEGFGRDLSGVRLHDAGHAAAMLDARAFTVGQDVYMSPEAYRPQSRDGLALLAHEVGHTLQQGVSTGVPTRVTRPDEPAERAARAAGEAVARGERLGAPARAAEATPAVARQGAGPSGATGHAGSAVGQMLCEGWVEVNELALVYMPGPSPKGGANLRREPDGPLLRWLPQNTKVFVLKHHRTRHWYAISVLTESGGEFGYVADWLLVRNLPDPDADVHKLRTGETPLGVAGEHYRGKGFDVWGKDKRYVVNALAWVNNRANHNFPGEPGMKKPSPDAAWWTTSATAGIYIWLPGVAHLNAIYESVAEHGGGTGSITADLWRTAKKLAHYVAYGLAFVGGLLHGFVKSIWDAIAGLVETVADVLVSIFTGNVLKDAKELWEALSKLTWEGITDALESWWAGWEKKLTSPDPWTAGHAHGYLTGYIMAEAAQLLLSGGTIAAAKAAIWTSRVGRAIKATRAFQQFTKAMDKVGEAGRVVRRTVSTAKQAVKASKVFTSLRLAREWVVQALRLGADTLADLTLEAINRLRSLPQAVLDRVAELSAAGKRWLLGCASKCKVDLGGMKKHLDDLSDAEIEQVVRHLDEAASRGRKVTIPKGKRGRLVAPVDLEPVVQAAIISLRKQLGKQWLSPRIFGTRLHAEVARVLGSKTLPPGWVIRVEQPFGAAVKDGSMTVRRWLSARGNPHGLLQELPKKVLRQKVRNLTPDVVLERAGGSKLVWDLTSKNRIEHLAKTLLYAEVMRDAGTFIRIAETYWRRFPSR